VQVDRYLDGDVAATLRLLVNAVQAAGPDAAAVDKRRAHWTAAHDARMEAAAQLLTRTLANSAGENAIDPGLVCAALGNGLSDDAIYVDETITYRGAILNHLNWEQPQSYYRTYGGLGQAIGTALGVKFAARDRTVVALMGDGTFMYNPMLQALAFSRNQDLPVLTVIFNNGGYDAMKKEHHAFYPDGISADHDIYPGFAVTGLNYEELAVPFGGFGRRVEKAGDLEAAIADAQAALADGKSAILNVMTAATGSPLGV
ncbi:MAG: thiamine pyrophosphate-dependent enzyme, partial [Alphaproteobacteria bacterium]|nr:thiamine pyrophosphate-dependent enzyme [Alphaproteobacteria bacterium]